MSRIRYLFMDRFGLPTGGDPTTVAIVRIEKLGRCHHRWQILSARVAKTRDGIRVMANKTECQGVGINRWHAHYIASNRVRALHEGDPE